jgi:hypothetical protein
MPRFFVNFRNDDLVAFDQEGVDAPDLEAARDLAIASARELIGEAVKHGGSTIPNAVIVSDENGKDLLTVSLSDIVPNALRGL